MILEGEIMRNVNHGKGIMWLMALTISVVLFCSPSLVWSNLSTPSRNIAQAAIPRMIDLGRNQCTPCKMMKPVLEELKQKYAGIIDIEYINVAENPDAIRKLGLPVRAIPFQVFYDASGNIVKRHYGYMSKEEILQAFKDLGFDRKKPESSK
jgi:thiol-disulfide isomerase/thioredoxin